VVHVATGDGYEVQYRFSNAIQPIALFFRPTATR